MAHGQRDDSDVESTGLLFTQADMAEHAARLGSPYVFYRSGALLFAETWGHGPGGWRFQFGPVGSTAYVCDDEFLSEGASLHWTLANGALASIIQTRLFVPTFSSNLGFQASFAGNTKQHIIALSITYHWGGVRYEGEIQYNPATEVLQYRNAAAALVTFATSVDDYTVAGGWTTVKLVLSMSDAQYLRFYWGGTEYDLSSYGLRPLAAGTIDYMLFGLEYIRSQNDAGSMYWDNLILTTEEPN